MKNFVKTLAGAILALASSPVIAAEVNTQVSASQTVTPPAVALRVDHQLTFPAATEGSPQLVLPPTDANAANVAVLNGAGRAATISVVESSINMDDGNGNLIAVSSFVGSPALGGVTLPASGEQAVKIGATRASLVGKPAGAYAGAFTFKVVY